MPKFVHGEDHLQCSFNATLSESLCPSERKQCVFGLWQATVEILVHMMHSVFATLTLEAPRGRPAPQSVAASCAPRCRALASWDRPCLEPRAFAGARSTFDAATGRPADREKHGRFILLRQLLGRWRWRIRGREGQESHVSEGVKLPWFPRTRLRSKQAPEGRERQKATGVTPISGLLQYRLSEAHVIRLCAYRGCPKRREVRQIATNFDNYPSSFKHKDIPGHVGSNSEACTEDWICAHRTSAHVFWPLNWSARTESLRNYVTRATRRETRTEARTISIFCSLLTSHSQAV